MNNCDVEEIPNRKSCHLNVIKCPDLFTVCLGCKFCVFASQGLSLAWPPLHRAAHLNDVRSIQQLVEDSKVQYGPSTCPHRQSRIAMEYLQFLQEIGWKDGGFRC